MRIIAIGGEPASGKTTLMRALLGKLKQAHTEHIPFKAGLIRGHKFASPRGDVPWVVVLGVYDTGEVFEGTDKLSMSVQPAAKKFIDDCDDDLVVIFEGDRLFNKSFLQHCIAKVGESNITATVLYTDAESTEARHKARGDSQTATFLKGRRTKINNIVADPSIPTEMRFHRDGNDTQVALDAILEKIGMYKTIEVTRDESVGAFRAYDPTPFPFSLFMKRFKEQHGLVFEDHEFHDLTKFKFDTRADVFRVVYIGARGKNDGRSTSGG